jgi:serine/threonine protein phosphatase PrpC
MQDNSPITVGDAAMAGQVALAIIADTNDTTRGGGASSDKNSNKKPKLAPEERPAPKGMFHGAEKGAKQFQEDSVLSWRSPNHVVTIGGIYDGHGGHNGMRASNAARDHSLKFFGSISLECEQWKAPNWHATLPKLFDAIHQIIRDTLKDQSQDRQLDEKGIVRTLNGDPIHGGCTGTVIVQIRNVDGSSTIINANVGDSTALLCFLDNLSADKYHMLTVDHGPENVDEYRRVQNLPKEEFPIKLLFVYDKTNVFRKYECPSVYLESGQKDERYEKNPWGNGLHPVNVRYEPAMYAVTPREVLRDSTCIAMTRALGDLYAHQFGLTHVPSITTYELPANRTCVVAVASDGIWDCWGYNDFSDFYRGALNDSNEDQVAGMRKVLDESVTRAIANFGAKHYDDAALVSWVIAPASSESPAAGAAAGAAAVDAVAVDAADLVSWVSPPASSESPAAVNAAEE